MGVLGELRSWGKEDFRGWNEQERAPWEWGPGPWRSWGMSVLGLGSQARWDLSNGPPMVGIQGKGVARMSSFWMGTGVTAPSLGNSDFGMTEGPALTAWVAPFLGWHHMGVLGSSASVPSSALDFSSLYFSYFLIFLTFVPGPLTPSS